MKINEQEIVEFVKQTFSLPEPELRLICGEGSDRLFYRIKTEKNKNSLILMIYGNDKAENDYYIHIQQFLSQIGVNVPAIKHIDHDRRWIFIEDLGDLSLFKYVSTHDRDDIIQCYKQVIDMSVIIFGIGYDRFTQAPFITAPAFDFELYRWEHTYFIDNYLRTFKRFQGPLDKLRANLDNIAHRLSLIDNRLIHRDLQSKNVIIKERKPYVIDFQGLRPGLPLYDIASLLCDPYVALDHTIIDELLNYYCALCEHDHLLTDRNAFFELFAMCTAQRLMQAMGAYCYLGIKKNKSHFLQYVFPAEKMLSQTLAKIDLFPELEKLV